MSLQKRIVIGNSHQALRGSLAIDCRWRSLATSKDARLAEHEELRHKAERTVSLAFISTGASYAASPTLGEWRENFACASIGGCRWFNGSGSSDHIDDVRAGGSRANTMRQRR